MKTLLTGSVVAGAMLFSADVQARDYDMLVCQGCSFNEARQFAIQKGAPKITCQPGPGQVVIDPDNQQCFSEARDYLVLDNSTKTLYAFTLAYANQGGQPWLMTLTANEFTPTAELHSLAINTAAFKEFVDDTLDDIAIELSRTFTNPTEIDNLSFDTTNYRASSLSTMTSEGCKNDPGYEATTMAFGGSFLQNLSITMHNMYRRSVDNGLEGHFFDGLNVKRFTQTGLQVGQNSLGLNASWEYVRATRQVQFDLSWNGPGSNYDAEINRIVIDLSLNELGTTVVSTLNKQQSVVGGVTVENMHPDNSSLNFPQIYNDCVAEALSESLSMMMTDSGGGVLGGSGWNNSAPPGAGGMPIPGGGSSWNSSSPDLCRMHFYRNYERIATILVPCP